MSQVLTTPVTAPRRLTFTFAKRHGVVVRRVTNGVAECAYKPTATPLAIAEARRYLRMPMRLEKISDPEFDALLRSTYESGSGAIEAASGLEETTDLAFLAQELPEPSDLLESDDDAPIIRLINAVLTQAVKENASDIHIEPFENRLVVRFRVDGVLREVLQSKRAVAPLVVSRIKVMSKLDIAEKRLPQDGRISLRDRRPRGRRARLDHPLRAWRARGAASARQAGRSPRSRMRSAWIRDTEQRIDELIHKPHGILLVTGPTGSGKTTTLYAGARAHQRQHPQHHDGRGSDRVLHRRHRPDAGQHQGRDDLRARPARHPAPGSGRGDGRRNPRPGDGADRRAGELDRSPGAVDAAYQHRGRRRHATARHGHRAVPALVQPGRRARAAPGAHAESRNASRPSRLANTSGVCWDSRRQIPRPRSIGRVATATAVFAAAPASTSWSSSTTRCAR